MEGKKKLSTVKSGNCRFWKCTHPHRWWVEPLLLIFFLIFCGFLRTCSTCFRLYFLKQSTQEVKTQIPDVTRGKCIWGNWHCWMKPVGPPETSDAWTNWVWVMTAKVNRSDCVPCYFNAGSCVWDSKSFPLQATLLPKLFTVSKTLQHFILCPLSPVPVTVFLMCQIPAQFICSCPLATSHTFSNPTGL